MLGGVLLLVPADSATVARFISVFHGVVDAHFVPVASVLEFMIAIAVHDFGGC